MFSMIRAVMMPGTHPHKVRMVTIRMDPQPQSRTASGGKMMARMTRRRDMGLFFEGF